MKKPKSIIRKVEELGEIITEITFDVENNGNNVLSVTGTDNSKFASPQFFL